MVTVFISQPMSGRSAEEIEDERDTLFADIACMCAERGENCQEISNWYGESGIVLMHPLVRLGKAIASMSKASVAVFAEGWESSRECRGERLCAELYGIPIEDAS